MFSGGEEKKTLFIPSFYQFSLVMAVSSHLNSTFIKPLCGNQHHLCASVHSLGCRLSSFSQETLKYSDINQGSLFVPHNSPELRNIGLGLANIASGQI